MARKKFFSDLYDSVHQRAYPDLIAADNNYKKLFAGRLRLDTLLSETLVIVDTQLLDGEFFLHHTPSSLSNLIAREDEAPMPLIIKSRQPRLEDALLCFYKKPNKNYLHGFSPSVIRDDRLRTDIIELLQKTKADKITTCWDILPIFLDAGVSPDEVERIRTGWKHWIDAQNHNLFKVEKWEGTWDLDSALDKTWLNSCVTSKEGRALVESIWNFRIFRSDNEKKILAFRQEAQSEATLGEADQIEAWYNRAYNLTTANQHGCDAFESIHTLLSLRSGSSVGINFPEVTLDFPDGFLRGLGSLPSTTFKTLYCNRSNPDTGSSLPNWWIDGNENALRQSMDCFAKATLEFSGQSPKPTPNSLMAAVETGGETCIGALVGSGVGTLFGAPIVGAILGAACGKFAINFCTQNIKKDPTQKIVQRITKIAQDREIK